MGILVCYDDFTYDVVTDDRLRELVETGSIFGYDTSAEWVKSAGEAPSPKGCSKRGKRPTDRRAKKRERKCPAAGATDIQL